MDNLFFEILSIYLVACVFYPHRSDELGDYVFIHYESLGVDVVISDKISDIKIFMISLYDHYSVNYSKEHSTSKAFISTNQISEDNKIFKEEKLLL